MLLFYVLSVILEKESKDLEKAWNSGRKSCARSPSSTNPTIRQRQGLATGCHSRPEQLSPSYDRSARRRDLYLTTYITHKRQTSITPVGFEPAVPASERPQTYVLNRAATAIGFIFINREKMGLCLERKGTSPVYRPQESIWLLRRSDAPH